ncbi:MAG TPA: carbohydrate kinase family protein [Candidatus Nanoarchaeia archaeon]|nr:carbohydrate kinase family protein [Candidatus Nanoarchaeia archaeon]
MYDVITIGSNTLDLFVHTDQSDIINLSSKEGCKEFISYPVGTKMLITKLLHNFGGCGTNTAVAFSRLGLKTAYIGKVGTDNNGKLILANLKKEKIDFLGAKGEESGFSIILDAFQNDRTILVYKGCNNDLRFNEVKKAKLKAKWLYLSSMLGESLEAMTRIAEHARNNKVKIAFNPSITILENETLRAMNLLRYADLLVLNKEEAEALVGNNTTEVNLKKLSSYGPGIVVITDGRNGITAYKDDYYYKVMPTKELQVVETTGAGDAFASTLTAGLIMNKPFEFCLKMGINNSESVIRHHGAQNKLLSRKKLFEIVNQDKRVVDKRDA